MELQRDGEVAVLRMRRGKANAINDGFLERLGALLGELGDARALVITGHEGFFSGGLDLPAVLAMGEAELRAFIQRFGEGMLRIFELPLPVVAAVNGHAIAGGCVLALQCDARLMAEGTGRIGLSEAQLGIGLPPMVLETLRCQVPAASLLPIALEGRLFDAAEAVRVGLIHEAVPAVELETRALQRARGLASAPTSAYAQIKAGLRRHVVEAIRRDTGQGDGAWVKTWFSPGGQERVRAAVERLNRKK